MQFSGSFPDHRIIFPSATIIKITFYISTISSQSNTNLSIISLEECETVLKSIYELDYSYEKLILLKTENNTNEFNIPIINYILYTKEGQQLNLSLCNDIPIYQSIPVTINEDKEFYIILIVIFILINAFLIQLNLIRILLFMTEKMISIKIIILYAKKIALMIVMIKIIKGLFVNAI